jgi:hypothetical protein
VLADGVTDYCVAVIISCCVVAIGCCVVALEAGQAPPSSSELEGTEVTSPRER